jgi:flagellar basal-body rod modification protein FlgD
VSIAPISGSSGTTDTSSTSGLKADSNTFMKLLIANLQHQDPMQPQDSSAYMQQLSQMTMVEQMTSVAATAKNTAESQQAAAAVQLIGRTVTYLDADGNTQSGVVEKADVSGDRPTLTIAGTDGIDAGLVMQVSQ